VQLGLNGIKTYNMQVTLELCVCLAKCDHVEHASQILMRMLKAPAEREQQEMQARIISGRIGSLSVLRDLDIVFAKCLINSSIQQRDEQTSDENTRDSAQSGIEQFTPQIVNLMAELCSRSGTNVRIPLPRPDKLLSWCLEQHFDHDALENPKLIDDVAGEIKQQEDSLKHSLSSEQVSLKLKEESSKRGFADACEKLEKWKQLVETWCVCTIQNRQIA
jgi:hypothetical protein